VKTKVTIRDRIKKPNAKYDEKTNELLVSNNHLLKPGRHECDCQGRIHDVKSNCLKCGRISCDQEREGPCFFCGDSFTSETTGEDENEEEENTKGALKKALKHRNRLLKYDQNFEERTKVIDLENEYYDSNKTNIWASEQEEAERKEKAKKLRALKKKNKRMITFSIDMEGRSLLVDRDKSTDKDIERLEKELQTIKSNDEVNREKAVSHPSVVQPLNFVFSSDIKTEALQGQWKESLIPSALQDDYDTVDVIDHSQPAVLPHVQYESPSEDKDDQGKCISMHQPWASLMAYGIKTTEGREWNSSLRGRLWIASTKTEPTEDQIRELEAHYRQLGFEGSFPKSYPTGVLLGCCDLDDVCPRSNYQEKYPNGQPSEASFMFMIKNPRLLTIPLSILGQPKIYNLESDFHQAALQGLHSLPEQSILKN